jgi:hypothetical protein
MTRRSSLPALLAVLVAALLPLKAATAQTITDPDKGGDEFALQGEYVGQAGENDKVGVQVIALGDNKFRAVAYPGGLPGAGWRKDEPRQQAEGELLDGAVVFRADGNVGTLRDGKLIVQNADGNTLTELKKVQRTSDTLGAKPPAGAIVLFDGSNTEHWKNGRMTEDGLLWMGTETKEGFGDFKLHLEFRLPFMPKARGQGRANSGVYIDGRYEVQVLDSFGLEGRDNECGGIYSISAPAVNMCLPPLVWQTYDIDFTAARYDDSGKKIKNARATIRHNGVVIHDDRELTKGTPGKLPEGPGAGPLYFQDHGNPVVYRNIWVLKK